MQLQVQAEPHLLAMRLLRFLARFITCGDLPRRILRCARAFLSALVFDRLLEVTFRGLQVVPLGNIGRVALRLVFRTGRIPRPCFARPPAE